MNAITQDNGEEIDNNEVNKEVNIEISKINVVEEKVQRLKTPYADENKEVVRCLITTVKIQSNLNNKISDISAALATIATILAREQKDYIEGTLATGESFHVQIKTN